MAEFRTRALVLRCLDQRESDRLVHLFSEDRGRIAVIAKGARRSRRRFPGTLEILTLIEARIVEPPRASLMRLEGARVLAPFESLVNNVGRYAIGCQLLEILGRFTGEQEANPDLFHFSTGVLDVLRREAPDRLLALLVLIKTVARLGYRPQLSHCAACGKPIRVGDRGVGFESRYGGAVCSACHDGAGGFSVPPRILLALDRGIRSPLAERGRLGLLPQEIAQLELLVDRFVRFHLGLELRSAPFLRSLLASGRLDAPDDPGENARALARGDTAPGAGEERGPVGSKATRL